MTIIMVITITIMMTMTTIITVTIITIIAALMLVIIRITMRSTSALATEVLTRKILSQAIALLLS